VEREAVTEFRAIRLNKHFLPSLRAGGLAATRDCTANYHIRWRNQAKFACYGADPVVGSALRQRLAQGRSRGESSINIATLSGSATAEPIAACTRYLFSMWCAGRRVRWGGRTNTPPTESERQKETSSLARPSKPNRDRKESPRHAPHSSRRGFNASRSPPSAKKCAHPSLFSCNRDEIIYKQLQKFRPCAGEDQRRRQGERG
jgi:hypothetical protein